jgi:UDP-2-acetamido-2,6-beta-L-arabino-hexul-4-ose reductase
MKILITGSKGFLGRNLIERISNYPNIQVIEFDINNKLEEIEESCKDCDFVYNFAAVHRPLDTSEFKKVNFSQFELILKNLEKFNNKCPVLYTSTIQSNNGTLYGESKYLAENALRDHAKKMNSRGIIYRLTNVFGKWARPNSHSVVATFCYNVRNDFPLVVSDPEYLMHFVYIDDVIDSFVKRLQEGVEALDTDSGIYTIDKTKIIDITLGDLSSLILSFKEANPQNLNYIQGLFYKTYLSYGK